MFGKWDDNITFYFAVPNYRSTFKNLLGHNFEYMTDFVQVMNNNIKNLPNDIEGYRQRVIQLESNIKNYEELKNKTFDKEGEWLELQKKIKAIEKELGMGESIEAQPEIQDTDDNDDIDDELSDEDQSNTKKTRSKSSSGTQSRIATAPSSLGISKTGTATGTKPISRTDLVDFIAEYLDIPIKKGKFRERALGIFKTQPEVIRLKDGKDIETLFHEMGHYFDKKLGLVDEKHLGELYALGEPASKDSYTEKEEIMKEGVAEFVRLFTLDPTNA